MAERRQHPPSRKEKTESWKPPCLWQSGIVVERSRQFSYANRDVNTNSVGAVIAGPFLFHCEKETLCIIVICLVCLCDLMLSWHIIFVNCLPVSLKQLLGKELFLKADSKTKHRN